MIEHHSQRQDKCIVRHLKQLQILHTPKSLLQEHARDDEEKEEHPIIFIAGGMSRVSGRVAHHAAGRLHTLPPLPSPLLPHPPTILRDSPVP